MCSDLAILHAAAAKSLQSCPTLCDLMDCSLPGCSVHGILQARVLEWVAAPSSNACMHAKSLQSCLTLCDPMDSSPPGFSVHRVLQVRILEWVAISISRGSFQPRDRLQVSYIAGRFFTTEPLGKPKLRWLIKINWKW